MKLLHRKGLVVSYAGRAHKLDAQFGYADAFEEATGAYRKLIWAQMPPELLASTALLVREAEAKQELFQTTRTEPAPWR